MSRPPTATSVLEVKGTFEKNPSLRRSEEPIPPEGAMVKPKTLRGNASKLWDEYAPICEGMGTADRGDEPTFAMMCEQWAEYRKDKKNFPTSRLAWLTERFTAFGIAGAASRRKLAVKKDDKAKKDPADKYLNGATIGPGNSLRQ